MNVLTFSGLMTPYHVAPLVIKLQWNSNQNTRLFVQENVFKMSSTKRRPFYSGLIVLLLYATREYGLSIVHHVAPAPGITAPQKVTGINVWTQLQEFLHSPAPILCQHIEVWTKWPDGIFNYVFFRESVCTFIQISLECLSVSYSQFWFGFYWNF